MCRRENPSTSHPRLSFWETRIFVKSSRDVRCATSATAKDDGCDSTYILYWQRSAAVASKGQTVCVECVYWAASYWNIKISKNIGIIFIFYAAVLYMLYICTSTCPPDFQNGRTGASFANQYFKQPNVIPPGTAAQYNSLIFVSLSPYYVNAAAGKTGHPKVQVWPGTAREHTHNYFLPLAHPP